MRRVLAPIVVVGLVSLLFGCSTSDQPTEPAPTTQPPSAADVLTNSLNGVRTMPVHTVDKTETTGGTVVVEGDSDLPAKAIQLTITTAQVVEVRLLVDDVYLKAPGTAKPWTHIDITKLAENSALRGALDAAADIGLLGGLVSAKDLGGGKYEGTADLRKAAEAAANQGNRDNLQRQADLAGAGAAAVPFQATVDDQGRLTLLTYAITSPKAGTTRHTVTFSDWGKPVTVAKPPAGDTAEATPAQYAQF